MEIRITIFLFFASVTIITNTLLILFAYKAFANITAKVTETVAEFEKSGETREWIDSLRIAAEQAAAVSEVTKQKLAEFEPVISRAQENYSRTLAEAVAREREAEYKAEALDALRSIESPQSIDVVCQAWADTRDETLAQLVAERRVGESKCIG